MEWREADGVRWLEARLPGARAAFSTRLGGVSEAPFDSLNLGVLTDDEPGAVVENRGRLAAALGLAPERIAIGRQVHGAELATHAGPQRPSPFAEPGAAIPEVDGHVDRRARVAAALLVFVADCLPVALSGPGGVAMLHCGWRGLAAGIVARGAEAVGATDAAIGPGIGPCCYEVGDEVLDAFAGLGEGIADGRMLDLPEVARAPARAGRGRAGRDRRALHQLRAGALLLPPARAGPHRAPGRPGLARWRAAERGRADPRARSRRRSPPTSSAPASWPGPGSRSSPRPSTCRSRRWARWPRPGSTLVGENRQQDLAAKHERWGDAFEWDFIGNLQSRKVKQLLPVCRLIHSVASESALAQLGSHGRPGDRGPGRGQRRRRGGQGRVAPAALGAFIAALARCGSPG